jgi:hypothetical protein
MFLGLLCFWVSSPNLNLNLRRSESRLQPVHFRLKAELQTCRKEIKIKKRPPENVTPAPISALDFPGLPPDNK